MKTKTRAETQLNEILARLGTTRNALIKRLEEGRLEDLQKRNEKEKLRLEMLRRMGLNV